MNNQKVLVVDDAIDTLEMMRAYLQSLNCEPVTAATGQQALDHIHQDKFAVILTDLQLPDVNGIELVKQVKEISPETEIIMISGYGSVSKAVEATKAGAFYFIEKPIEFDELSVLLEKAFERRQQAQEIQQLKKRLTNRSSYYNLIGSCKQMQEIYDLIDNVAESDANILLLGESGTGKELVANAIHFRSLRAKKPLIKINCSSLPKELIESELFGHTKGAFTGAGTEKTGLIGQANGGTLFLDEIGEMPTELQPKLLRVLQERVYFRLGSEKAQEANFRLISATNRNPMDAINDGKLRDDLYYRINTIEIFLPPLRERGDDIQNLAIHFLQEFAEKYNRPVYAISPEAQELMNEAPWPGNVRELRNMIERAVLLAKGEVIEASMLPIGQGEAARVAMPNNIYPEAMQTDDYNMPPAQTEIPPSYTPAPAKPIAEAEVSFEDLGTLILNNATDFTKSNGQGRQDIFDNLEKVVVSAALKRTKGNKQAAANLLGVYRPRLYGMIKKHKIEV
ncbi:MAG: sigma-54 dependent transcriptional regulator [Acidobacteriota bacterium]